VVDGDSLPKLAGRYLKDPDRAWEIYRLNRDVLRSPDLLPIGIVLKLPTREISSDSSVSEPETRSVLVTGAYGANLPQNDLIAPQGPSEGSAIHAATNLVPVRPITAEYSNAPEARLLQPVPINGDGYGNAPAPTGNNALRGSSLVFPINAATAPQTD
jgi:hypothetical protein